MEGHHSESHRLHQRRHSTAAERVAAVAGLPGREPVATKWVEVQLPCTLHPEGQDRQLTGSTSTATPPHHQIHELVAISAKFFTNDSKKTLVLASSAEEKRGVNQTSALGPLSTCMRQGNQATCRTR